jgi:hypothetical protein
VSLRGQAVTLTANVQADAPGSLVPTGTVTFLDGTRPLATVRLTNGVANLITASLSVGNHSLTAVYHANGTFFRSTSPILKQIVALPVHDITAQIGVHRGSFVTDPVSHDLVQKVTITNVGKQAIWGPISLVLDGLGSGIMLVNGTATTAGGSPYVDFLDTGSVLGPGQSVSLDLEFADPSNAAISYTRRVLAGLGPR